MRRNGTRGIKITIIVVLSILIIGVIALFAGMQYYRVDEIIVEGNEKYTKDEIINLVMTDPLDKYSLLFRWRIEQNKFEEIPFVDELEITVESPKKVKIKVYEKTVVGYVEHLGYYLYFDKDGTVVESSTEQFEGVPMVSGIPLDTIVLYKPLPVENDEIFKSLLNLTQLMEKYAVHPDNIKFNNDLEITLYFGEAKVLLGEKNPSDDKIFKLSKLLPELDGLEGTLHLENYDESMKNITFNIASEQDASQSLADAINELKKQSVQVSTEEEGQTEEDGQAEEEGKTEEGQQPNE